MRVPGRFALGAAALVGLAGLQHPVESRQGTSPRDALRTAFAGRHPFVVVYGTGVPAIADRLRTTAEGIGRAGSRLAGGGRVVADHDLTDAERRAGVLVLVGRPEANAVLAEIAGGLPLSFVPDGFTFGDRTYRGRSRAVQILATSPWNADGALVLVAGATHETPLPQEMRIGRSDYAVFDGERRVRYGRLRDGRPDPARDTDVEREWERWTSALTRIPLGHGDVWYRPDTLSEPDRRAVAGHLEERWARASRAVGDTPRRRVTYYLYPSVEQKGRLVESVAVSSLDATAGEVHAVHAAERRGLETPHDVELLLDWTRGAAAAPYLRSGWATNLAGGSDPDAAVPYVHQGFAPTVAALRGDASTPLPDPVRQAFASSWVAFLHETLGERAFLDHYAGRVEVSAELEGAWTAGLNRKARAAAARLDEEAARSRRRYDWSSGVHRGVNFTHSNGRDAGYATARSNLSLGAVAELGANAVALVPYGFSDINDLTTIRHAGDGLGTESDESLRVAARRARELGLRVMLKPQIWISSRFWPSQIDFETDAEWRDWFASYERWIASYALLAEELQVDLFCIGTELTHPAIEQPARMRALIARIRRVYHGPLVYAANWYREFEEVVFWDALDLVGLDNYFPLADHRDADEPTLAEGARRVRDRIAAVAARAGKPVIFTEVGFAADRHAGTPGSESSRSGIEDAERQAWLYRLTFETYWQEPWFHGLYWWKWFSDPDNAGTGRDPWTPRGRPAEHVLREWFGATPRSVP